ncbi:DUF397 domain-containing protein [Nocardia transvalensis]|uniref:DUF397 domain-containing protein n=1 Tax=Nocardia transvalensis TaxID=37333 RepID=UPI000A032D6A|nr:DUF397 domain-containing protein [Nocardia transvalensis]
MLRWGEYVEVAFLDEDAVGARNSKTPSGPALIFRPRDRQRECTADTSGHPVGVLQNGNTSRGIQS